MADDYFIAYKEHFTIKYLQQSSGINNQNQVNFHRNPYGGIATYNNISE